MMTIYEYFFCHCHCPTRCQVPPVLKSIFIFLTPKVHTFCNNQTIFVSSNFPAMFWIVMDEHILWNHVDSSILQWKHWSRHWNLKSSHIPGISGIFQAILITFEEKFELISEKIKKINFSTHTYNLVSKSEIWKWFLTLEHLASGNEH